MPLYYWMSGMSNPPRPSIVLVEDHPLMRASLKAILGDAGFAVIGEAESEVELATLLADATPDVVLVDLGLGSVQEGMRCLDIAQQRLPTTKTVVFSAFDDRSLVAEALARGAAAFIHKRTNPAKLVEIVEIVLAGKHYVAVDFSGDGNIALTEREQQILGHLARGLSNRQISGELWITEKTVKFHLSNLYRKLGVQTRAQAIAWALRR